MPQSDLIFSFIAVLEAESLTGERGGRLLREGFWPLREGFLILEYFSSCGAGVLFCGDWILVAGGDFGGVEAVGFFEGAGEVAGVAVADGVGDFDDAALSGLEELAGALHAFLSQVSEYGGAESFLEAAFELEFV